MFRTGTPHYGPFSGPETFHDTSLAHPPDIGMVHSKPNGDYWQMVQNKLAASVMGTNGGRPAAYWYNYASYQVTPTIGSSAVYELAGFYEVATAADEYCAVRQGGTFKVKSVAATFADGTPIVADGGTANSVGVEDSGIATIALAGGTDTGGGIGSWQNPFVETVDISITMVDVSTVATAACTVDIGTTATSATTSSNNLLTGLDVNAATGAFDNITDKGASGKSRQQLAAGKWVTVSRASGASAGLVGRLHIRYFRNGSTTNNARPNRIGVATGARDADGNVTGRFKVIPA